jgi:hypothetical protein
MHENETTGAYHNIYIYIYIYIRTSEYCEEGTVHPL